ncbi:MAG TPA: AsmA-like C-terminal region-containing protein [Verrucomicrobiae bacterium]|nr:AsmA-like C-terminal region-containing protein [Verrucomicrobiae bacterium]
MATPAQRRFWRICRIYFRRFRISVLLLIVGFLVALLYLNRVGLPDFVKTRLQEKLRERGVDLQFTRLRWRWDQGIVAENVQFGRTHEPTSPKFSARQARVQMDYSAFLKLQFQVNGLVLRQGEFVWQLAGTNVPPREIAVTNIQSELRLLPGDLWELDRFHARFAGANIELAGVITNASAVRAWKIFQGKKPARPGTTEHRLQKLADTLERIHFSTTPDLNLDIRGDALKPQSFAVRLKINTPDAQTPWGDIQNALARCSLLPATNKNSSHAEIILEAAGAQTRWGNATNVEMQLDLFSTAADPDRVEAKMDLNADEIATRWGNSANAHFTAEWIHAITNAIPLSGHGELRAENTRTRWGDARRVEISGKLSAPETPLASTDESWWWWTNLAPFALDWTCDLRDVISPKLAFHKLAFDGKWRAPELTLTNISSELYGGIFEGAAKLNVASRELQFSNTMDFDAQKIAPLLTEHSRHWLSQFSWKKPPVARAEGSLILPAWTNRHPDLHLEVQPTVKMAGHVQAGSGAFRGMPFDSAQLHFSYSNLLWRIPDLVATRPEGSLKLFHRGNDRTHDYYFRVQSSVSPEIVRPLLDERQQRGFDMVTFSNAPQVQAEIWGQWNNHESIGAKGFISVTNFQIKGETIGAAQTGFEYTNGFILCLAPRAETGAQHASAASLGIDIPARKIYLTNGVGTLDPMIIYRMISSNVVRIMEPYHFLQPPSAHVEGIIPMHDPFDADLHFDITGGEFEWWKFKVPHVEGRVDWVGHHLTLTNIQAGFYGGTASGSAEFDFLHDPGVDFGFDLLATDANLHSLMRDLTKKTDRLEGRLTTHLKITRANSADLATVQGEGKVSLRDGLIWEIPIFGVFSPVLDSIVPGLGSSRASEGSASFIITNGVARSDDLEIRASMMRLQYQGTMDLKGPVNARVQAELLRDTWVVGRAISLVFWPVTKIFEYKITGTLNQPKTEPLFFLPKIVLLPFHPLRSMKELLPEIPNSNPTNAPPIFPPQNFPGK